MFEKDLYNNIKYALENAEKSIEFFNHKTGYYKSFNVGDTFNFGRYYGKPIKWKILRKSNDSMYIISAEELCSKQLHSNCNDRSSIFKSGIIEWLNGEFYSNAFTEYEKEEIGTIGSYKVGLLTKEDAESLMTQQERAIGSCWWLWSSYTILGTDFWCVISDGTFRHQDGSYESGIRPTLNLKF